MINIVIITNYFGSSGVKGTSVDIYIYIQLYIYIYIIPCPIFGFKKFVINTEARAHSTDSGLNAQRVRTPAAPA